MIEILPTRLDRRLFKLKIYSNGALQSYEGFINLLIQSDSFRAAWSTYLAGLPFAACRWECPALAHDSAGTAFECVVSDHPALARTTMDARDFNEHFHRYPEAAVIDFENLGRDARLVVPCPINEPRTDYAHLLSFLRTAEQDQLQAFWLQVGRTVRERGWQTPLWISTAGMGVYWLHVRLDRRPKYYEHAAYRQTLEA